jgi:hypothetical protein
LIVEIPTRIKALVTAKRLVMQDQKAYDKLWAEEVRSIQPQTPVDDGSNGFFSPSGGKKPAWGGLAQSLSCASHKWAAQVGIPWKAQSLNSLFTQA